MLEKSVLALVALASFAAPVQAAVVTRNFIFSGSDIENISGSTPSPLSSVYLSFTVAFDPLVDYNEQTAGIALLDSNLALDSTLAFTYSPAFTQRMFVGGLGLGTAITGADVLQNDFILVFEFANTFAPEVNNMLFTNATSNGYRPLKRSLSVRSITAPVPEPASWAMMLAGFGLVGGFLRRSRRRQSAVEGVGFRVRRSA